MKKFVILSLVCLFLIGCDDLRDVIPGQSKDIEEYSLVSTEDRLVFKNDDYYEIIYYDNENIVKVETAIKFATEEEAENHYKEEKNNSYGEARYVYNVFVFEEIEDYWTDYKDLSKSEIIQYMKNANYEYLFK